MSKALSDLPEEILEIIINNVNDEDLLHLRLSSKRMHNSATARFANGYFTNLRVFLSRRSLQMLNDICAHSFLGPHVKSISFASQRLLKAGLQPMKPDAEPVHESCSWLLKDQVDEEMHYKLAYSTAYGEQVSMVESGESVFLLTTALEALKRYNTPVFLGLVDNIWDCPEYGTLGSYSFGHECFEQYNDWSYWECCRSSTMKLLLTAVHRSGLPLTRLLIRFETQALMTAPADEFTEHEDPNLGSIDILDGFGDDFLPILFRDLRSFQLELLNSYHDWEGATPDSVVRILELANNLEILHVDVGGASYSDWSRGLTGSNHWEEIETIIDGLNTPSLREIHFVNCMIPHTKLGRLLQRSSSSIRVLEVSKCCIGWPGTWSAFLSSLLGYKIRFDNLTLEDLYRESPGQRSCLIEYIVAGTREFGGDGDVTVDIQHFISELQDSGF